MKEIDTSIIEKIKELRSKDFSYKEIKSETNVSYDKIRRVCKIFGLTKKIYCSKNKELTEEETKNIQKIYDEFGSVRKASKESGYSRELIKRILKIKLKIKSTKKPGDYVNKARRKRKIVLIEYKGGCCQNCSYKKCVSSLQFHHIDSTTKDFTIGGRNYSLEKMKNEVDKCLLVCANCHIEIHEEFRLNGFSEIVNKILNK